MALDHPVPPHQELKRISSPSGVLKPLWHGPPAGSGDQTWMVRVSPAFHPPRLAQARPPACIADAARREHWHFHFIGSCRDQDQARNIIFAWVTSTFKSIN